MKPMKINIQLIKCVATTNIDSTVLKRFTS